MQKRNSVATMEKLQEAAAQLFDSKGYFNVSIKEIGRAAGCNSALISYHFGGKQLLYQAVINRQLVFLNEVVEQVKAMPLSPLKKIKAYSLAILESQLDPKKHVNILYQEVLHPSGLLTEESWEKVCQLGDFVRTLLLQAADAKEIRPPEEEEEYDYVAFILTSITEMLFLVKDRPLAINPHSLPVRAVLEQLTDYVLRPLLPGKN